MNKDLPIEYKKGFTKFLGRQINLSQRVLIPRIETEFWVAKVLSQLKKRRKKFFALDIFAGSGCIGIAVLKSSPEQCRRVDFIDLDPRAISQIKINLKINKISPKRYRVIKSDLFEKLEKEEKRGGLAPYRSEASGAGYDFIFANPPYVARERLPEVQSMVLKYEPKSAILAGKKGLYFIKKFLKAVKNFLKEKGFIFMEFDPDQKEDIQKILEKEGYKNFCFQKDQFKKYRFVKISKSL